MIGTILLVLIVLALIGAFGSGSYSYSRGGAVAIPGGFIGLAILLLVVWLFIR